MKRAIVPLLFATLVLVSCGGGGSSSSSSAPATSGIKQRAFVTNAYANQIVIVNAANDTVNTTFVSDTSGNVTSALANTISAGTGAGMMKLSSDKKITLVFDEGSHAVAVVDNATEAATGLIVLPDFTQSMAISADDKTAYAAVPNVPISGQPSGGVEVMDIVNFTVPTPLPVAAAHRIVMSHNGGKLLVFSDNSNQVTVIDLSSQIITPVPGFDHPVWGVFSPDDTIAYILSCGPECGGSGAKVTVLNLSNLTLGAGTSVSAATTALLDGNSLYVAGTRFGAGACGQPLCNLGGRLDVIDTGSLSVVKSGVAISDGYHQAVALGNDNRLFIGATTCSNTTQGCLSIYNTSAQTVAVSQPNGDVTGLAPIPNRHVVYVVEGGELRIYDTTTDAPQKTQIDIVGRAVDVKFVD